MQGNCIEDTILEHRKARDFIAQSEACLSTRLEIYHGSQYSREDNRGVFSLVRAIERIAINRELLIGFDRRDQRP